MNKQIRLNGRDSRSVVCGSRYAVLPNISVEYMYRDASNYKRYEIVNFSNPQKIGIAEIRKQINDVLSGLMLFPEQPIFRPEWVGLPTAFLFEMPGYQRNDDDHDWHELIAVEETDDSSTVGVTSNISDFIELLRKTHSTIAKK